MLPALRAKPSKGLAQGTGLSERSIGEIRNGHSRPRPCHQAALIRAAADFADKRLRERGIVPLGDGLAA